MWPNPQFPADLVTFTEEILNRKLHFLCSVNSRGQYFVFKISLTCKPDAFEICLDLSLIPLIKFSTNTSFYVSYDIHYCIVSAVKDFFSKYKQISIYQQICSHLPKKFLKEKHHFYQ